MGTLELVAAVAANGVIGRGGQLAWHLPDDLKFFKALTMGRPVIMGRRTYESIGRPLPGRRNVVVSGTWQGAPAGVEVVRTLGDAVRVAREGEGPAFVIGGAVLYEAAMPVIDVMHLTELDEAVEGDTYFPVYEKGEWRLVKEVRHERDERHAVGFWIRTYERVRGA